MNTSWPQSHHGSQEEFNALAAGKAAGAGRYVLQRMLGRGGMGVVWLAQDRLLREPVALKFLPPPIASDPAALASLRQEAQRTRRLSHPNIVRIYDLHDAPDEPAFISMEFVEGSNLHTLRASRPGKVLPWPFLAPLAGQLASALAYAHGERVIHRDLKPGNLMLDAAGRLKLADFGLASVMSDSMSRISEGRHTSGTLAYMSPQQADGRKAGVTDDLYSLGATLYELLAGSPPFHSGDIGHQVRHVHPESMESRLADSGLGNDIPPEASSLVMACLSKDPGQRPQSAEAVLEFLRAASLRNNRPPAAFVQPVSSPAGLAGETDADLDSVLVLHEAPAAAPAASRPAVGTHSWRWRRRAWMLSAACAVAVLGLAGWRGWPRFSAGQAKVDSPSARPTHAVPGSTGGAQSSSSGAVTDAPGFEVIFNGRDLSGWTGDPEFWTVKDGVITAFTAEEGIERRRNTCLVWKDPVKDFELRLSFKLVDVISAKPANSGVLYRSRKLEGHEYRGYQVDLHGQHTGKLLLLEGTLADPRTTWGQASLIKDSAGLPVIQSTGTMTAAGRFDAVVRKEDWNELVVLARGRHLTHWINGVVTMTAEDQSGYCPSRSGALALELKRATVLQFKDIRLKHLPPDQPWTGVAQSAR